VERGVEVAGEHLVPHLERQLVERTVVVVADVVDQHVESAEGGRRGVHQAPGLRFDGDVGGMRQCAHTQRASAVGHLLGLVAAAAVVHHDVVPVLG